MNEREELNKVRPTVNEVLEKVFPGIKIEVEDDELVVQEEGVRFGPVIETVKGIGNREREVVKWWVGREEYDPGVRYYPDGSGEPPSVDTVDVIEPSHLGEAISVMVAEIAKTRANWALEEISCREMAEEIDEEWPDAG